MSFSIAKTPSLKGKTALVTGGNIGLGFETVKALASKGAHVLLAARNEEKGKAAVTEVQKLVPNARVELLRLDLACSKPCLGYCLYFLPTLSRPLLKLD